MAGELVFMRRNHGRRTPRPPPLRPKCKQRQSRAWMLLPPPPKTLSDMVHFTDAFNYSPWVRDTVTFSALFGIKDQYTVLTDQVRFRSTFQVVQGDLANGRYPR